MGNPGMAQMSGVGNSASRTGERYLPMYYVFVFVVKKEA